MNFTINQIDLNAFNSAMMKIAATSKKDLTSIITQQAKLLAIQCMHFTPPFADGVIPNAGQDGSTKADQKQGVEAVKRDILRTMTPPSLVFKDGYKSKWLEKVVKRKDGKKMQDYLDSVKSVKLNKYKVAEFDPKLHLNKRVRGNRFRPDYQHKMVMDERAVNRYIKQVQKRVGQMKAGWAVAVQKFGGIAPAWVRNLIGISKGTADILVDSTTSYSVEMSNYASNDPRLRKNYEIAVRIRTNAMVRQYEDFLQKNAKQALKR